MNAHCETAIRLFAAKPRQDRLLNLASAKRRRRDLIADMLHDTRRLDPAVLTRVSGSILAAMRRRGAGALAYCIADHPLDDTELALEDALDALVGKACDALVFAVNTKIAYYENHEGEQFILERK